mgnify:CR=1 FL=1
MIITLTALAFFIASCGVDTRSGAEKAPEVANMVNNQALERSTPDIGGIKLVKYSPSFANEGISDMESRGYKVKQITEASATLFQSPSTTVMYERIK